MRLRRGALAPAVLGLVAASCVPEADVAIALSVPTTSAPVVWLEVGAVRGACPDATTLLGGLPLGDGVARIAFSADAPQAPTFGALARERWAFIATARDASCGVRAIGCKGVDLATSSEVSINLVPVAEPVEGACAAGLVCQYAHCIDVPGATSGTPQGCSLDVVGGGTLADPISVDVGTTMVAAAPALAAAGTTFVASAIDSTSSADLLRITRRRLDLNGATTDASSERDPTCTGSATVAGVSLASTSTGGVLEARRGPGCGEPPVVVTELTPSRTRALYTLTGLPAGSTLRPHSLVREASSGRMYLATTSAQGVRIESVTMGGSGGPVSSLPAAVSTFVDMAAGDASTVWLGRDRAGSSVAGLLKTGIATSFAVPLDARAIAARGSAFEVLSVDTNGFARVERLSEAGANLGSFDFGSPGGPPATDFALVASGDFMVVALGVPGDVWLSARSIRDAPLAPNTWRHLGDAIPLARRRRDGALTLASAGASVAVSWLTAARPGPDDVPFGYAVIGCESRKP